MKAIIFCLLIIILFISGCQSYGDCMNECRSINDDTCGLEVDKAGRTARCMDDDHERICNDRCRE